MSSFPPASVVIPEKSSAPAPLIMGAKAGEFEGWFRYPALVPYEDLVGPFYFRLLDDGRARSAFRAEARHMNAFGRLHGGCLMSFSDFALFMIARDALGPHGGVTVHLDHHFIDAVQAGDLVEAEGEVTRAGGAMIFVRGRLFVDDKTVATFSGLIKKLKQG